MSEPVVRPGRPRASLLRLAWLGLAAAGLGLFVFVDIPWAQSPPPVSVEIQQLDWLGPDGEVSAPSSTAGIAEFSFSAAAAGLAVGEQGAFLNLYTSVDAGTTYQLAVENLFVQFDSEESLLGSRLGVLIDLGNAEATAVASVSYQVSLTLDPVDVAPPPSGGGDDGGGGEGVAPEVAMVIVPAPVPLPNPDDIYFEPGADSPDDLPSDYVVPAPAPLFTTVPLATAPVYVAAVQRKGLSFGGYGGGGLVTQGHPPRPHPFRPVLRPGGPAPPPPPPPPGRPRPLGGVLGPVPVVNESPMSCAPSAIARSIRYMLNRRGRGGPTAQQIMGALYGLMGTSPVTGTGGAGMLNGKAAFSAANGLNITTVFPANVGQAATALNNGGDVELNIVWPNTPGCPGGGGHVAMVTGIALLPNGNFQITYVDDTNQRDDLEANNYHPLVVSPNGAIVSGFPCPGGFIAGLLAENMP